MLYLPDLFNNVGSREAFYNRIDDYSSSISYHFFGANNLFNSIISAFHKYIGHNGRYEFKWRVFIKDDYCICKNKACQ